jgi:hypothetical protein
MFARQHPKYLSVGTYHSLITNPWQTATTIWGSTALLIPIIYMALFATFSGNAGVEFSIFIGILTAIISLPALVVLRWALPKLLTLKQRNQRIISITGFVVSLFLAVEIPFSLMFSIGGDDANSALVNWSDVGGILFFTSPCLLVGLLTTCYLCRALFFRLGVKTGLGTT